MIPANARALGNGVPRAASEQIAGGERLHPHDTTPGPRERLLGLVEPVKLRNPLAQFHHMAVRGGAATPEQVIGRVRQSVHERDRYPWYDAEDKAAWRRVLQSLDANLEEWRDYAGWGIAWGRVPADAR